MTTELRAGSRPQAATPDATPGGDAPPASAATGVARWWWVVLATVLAGLALGVVMTGLSSTTYTGRASLIVSSNNRAPEQDAVLVQGYVAYFNDTSYQEQLAAEAGVEGPVDFTARAAAASPILLVEATAGSAEAASSSAAAVAEVFQRDINAVRDQERQAQVDDLNERIAEVTAAGGADAPGVVFGLRDQIATTEADRTDQLQELQFEGSVSANTPSLVTNVGLGGVAGLILGLLAALGLGRLHSRR